MNNATFQHPKAENDTKVRKTSRIPKRLKRHFWKDSIEVNIAYANMKFREILSNTNNRRNRRARAFATLQNNKTNN